MAVPTLASIKKLLGSLFVLLAMHSTIAHGDPSQQGGPVPALASVVHNETFVFPMRGDAVAAVIYGNPEIGYFRSHNFTVNGNEIHLRLIPPTFRAPVQFKAVVKSASREASHFRDMGARKYANPFPKSFDAWATVTRRPSFPFFLVNWLVKNEAQAMPVFIPVALNRLGEAVWAFSPPSFGAAPQFFELASQILPDGRFIFLGRLEYSHLYIIDSFGKIETDVDFRNRRLPMSTHTVQFLPESREVVYLAPSCRTLPWYDEFIPLFSGLRGWLRLLHLPRRTYRGSSVIRLSLDTLKAQALWSSFDTFSPASQPSLSVSMLASPDRYVDTQQSEEYLELLANPHLKVSSDWDAHGCDVDWTHENSVVYRPGQGYLVSVRNLNRLLFLDEAGFPVWQMGEGSENGFRYWFPRDGSGFSMQHDAQFLRDGAIAIYNNNASYRGQTGFRLASTVMVLRPDLPGPIQAEQVLQIPGAISNIRGSLAELPVGSFFVYHPGDPGDASWIYELDRVTRRQIARIRLNTFGYGYWKSFEAHPFQGFGGDEFMGDAPEWPRNPSPVKIGRPPNNARAQPDDPLSYSY